VLRPSRRPAFNPFEESTFVKTPFSDVLKLRTELERNAFQCFGERETAGSKAANRTRNNHNLGCSEYGGAAKTLTGECRLKQQRNDLMTFRHFMTIQIGISNHYESGDLARHSGINSLEAETW
jgi:hypothetical protein